MLVASSDDNGMAGAMGDDFVAAALQSRRALFSLRRYDAAVPTRPPKNRGGRYKTGLCYKNWGGDGCSQARAGVAVPRGAA